MIKHLSQGEFSSSRKSERGAALITVLLISTLLLSAGLALVLSSSLASTTTIDATSEMQAYFAAEAGLEATLNVLRGHIAPDASLAGTQMDFRTAVNPPSSNKTSDSLRAGTNAVARLSGWLDYSYQNPNSVSDWRVPLTASYAPFTGLAYRVSIVDPDDLGALAARKITTDPSYQPSRLLVRSEGFGPKGAVKKLEMVLREGDVDFSSPAAITLVGGSAITLSLGDSNSSSYSGADHAGTPMAGLPTIAVSAGNVSTAQTVVNALNGTGCPGTGTQITPCGVGALNSSNTPSFIRSADAARAFLARMKALAIDLGRYFPNKSDADDAGGLGTIAAPKFTFIDNYGSGSTSGPAVDLGSNHQGTGLLIVTGELDTHGNTDFEGLVLVFGRGLLDRSGGGNGVIRGSIMVANFDPNGSGSDFGNPTYTINGGGNSKIYYDSDWVRRSMSLSGMGVLGLREYH